MVPVKGRTRVEEKDGSDSNGAMRHSYKIYRSLPPVGDNIPLIPDSPRGVSLEAVQEALER